MEGVDGLVDGEGRPAGQAVIGGAGSTAVAAAARPRSPGSAPVSTCLVIEGGSTNCMEAPAELGKEAPSS